MNKYEIVRKIEEYAPLETQESWDCSGWGVDIPHPEIKDFDPPSRGGYLPVHEINKILFALTVTDKIIEQARTQGCDMIISHHPLFYVPLDWKDINIYSAHTNLDKTEGGRYKNVFGTYMHGSFLPKNPKFADYLLELALGEKLPPLDDTIEDNAHNALINKAY